MCVTTTTTLITCYHSFRFAHLVSGIIPITKATNLFFTRPLPPFDGFWRRNGMLWFNRKISGWRLRRERVTLGNFRILSDLVVIIEGRWMLFGMLYFWLKLRAERDENL